MFTVRDDPLARAVSLMGRVAAADASRLYRDRGLFAAAAAAEEAAAAATAAAATQQQLQQQRRSSLLPSSGVLQPVQEFRVTAESRRAAAATADIEGGPGAAVAAAGGGLPGMDILRGVYTLTQINQLTIDSLVFRLHSNATVILLVTFSIAITTRQYVGNPIDCVHTRDIPEDVLNTYCWIHSTYTVIDAFMKTPGSQVAYPGVQNSQSSRTPGKPNIKQVKYYQWVAFMLFFQAILFYTPRWLWKSWEGGKIHALMMDLDIGICSETEKRMKKKLMIEYLWENFRYHNWWAYKYYLCELLALINVIGQMFLMNRFFDGAFLTFGIRVIAFMESDQEDRVDPIIEIFPKMTKCIFYKYGNAGEVEKHDALCILPLNVVNEKIYVFLWFWFIILAILTFITIIYRIITILSPRMRVYLLRMRYRLIKKEDIDLLVRRSKIGDWFLLYMLGENVDSVIFRDVIHDLSTKLRLHQMDYAFRGDMQEA